MDCGDGAKRNEPFGELTAAFGTQVLEAEKLTIN